MSTNIRSTKPAAVTFHFGEFAFDCGSRQLLCNGVERHLSPKALQLLHLLLAVRPRALSREELYDALWPSTFVCETNLANVVNEVRRTLGDDARAAQYIRTAHGFGYAFCGAVASSHSASLEAPLLLCEGRKHLLQEGENVVGRAPDHIVIPDGTISRRHAVITVASGAFSIRDLNSKNGTFVDGDRIGGSPVVVTPSSRIELGFVAMSVVLRRISSTWSLQLDMINLRRQVAERLGES
ncbi:MAG TPA: FHA domain-containing protein [Thermoanaerobaculia bacterium]|nr:FHA domain-containing protein [Thermoanaerobaculia bacterium]